MGQLYEKMKADLKLRRYSARTQKSYLYYASRFVRHFMRPPTELGRDDVRRFLEALAERGESYLLPVKILSRLFRGRFLAALTKLHDDGDLMLKGSAAALADPAAFTKLRDTLYAKEWIVYAKAPFASPSALLRYLGQYTHRVAISNHRILHADDHEIVFRTRDRRVCRLLPLEFIRRFLQHLLPRGFVKIRHYGLLAAGNINTRLAAARVALDEKPSSFEPSPMSKVASVPEALTDTSPPSWQDLFRTLTGIHLARCPKCRGPLDTEPLPPPTAARAPPLLVP
jgi:hypothetical protein